MNKVFEKYKNIHENKRVFLVANGPSLNDIDLDLIKDEISFGMNRISLVYNKTQWRPTYYVFSSTNVRPDKPWAKQWQNSVRDSLNEAKVTSFVADMFMSYIDPYGNFPNTRWFNSLSENKPNLKGEIIESCFSTDVVDRIDKTGTTMNLALQLCYHMGFNEIIFVGADLGWTKDTGTNTDPNHFDKNYIAEILRPEKANNQMRNVHSLSLKYFNKRNKEVKFYNASKTTVLDVYPIIDFESYIKKGKVIERSADLVKAKKFWERPPQYSSLTWE
jgi:hypothetical protein